MDNQQLRKAGLKVTAPRLKILQIFENASQRHLSAEAVYKALLMMGEEIGLATVYRVLTQFEAAGLVTRLNFEEGHSVFELNQGPDHNHLVCVRCGRVDEFIDHTIEERQTFIAERLGYQITECSLTLYGICQACRSKTLAVTNS